jgi:hypothetical protein
MFCDMNEESVIARLQEIAKEKKRKGESAKT